jgi:membrane-anchored glycerophosphoryl diester phosphodiesterase (GDPDase)
VHSFDFILFHCPCFEALFYLQKEVFFYMASSQMDKERSSFMLEMKSLGPSKPSQRRFFSAQVTLRVLAIALTVPAISLMVNSSQSVVMFGFTFEARYSYSSALK